MEFAPISAWSWVLAQKRGMGKSANSLGIVMYNGSEPVTNPSTHIWSSNCLNFAVPGGGFKDTKVHVSQCDHVHRAYAFSRRFQLFLILHRRDVCAPAIEGVILFRERVPQGSADKRTLSRLDLLCKRVLTWHAR